MTARDGMLTDAVEASVNRPTSIVIAGEELQVIYEEGIFHRDGTVHLQDEAQLDRLLEEAGFDAFREADIYDLRFADGERRWMSTHPMDLKAQYDRRKKTLARTQAIAAYEQRMATCQKIVASLDLRVRDDTDIHNLVWHIKSEIEHQGPLYMWHEFDPSKLASMLNQLERMLNRCTKEWDIDDLAAELAAEKITHPDLKANNTVIEELGVLQIRSDGMIVPPSEDALFRFYRDRLRGLEGRETITLADAYRVDLELKLEEYAPADILKELELLPEFVEIDEKLYSVAYQYMQDEKGEWVPASIIEVPISAYRRIPHGYIRKIAEGVRMYLKVTKLGKELAKGFDTVELAKKVEQKEKGLKRPADNLSLEGPTLSPMWRLSRFKQNSRR